MPRKPTDDSFAPARILALRRAARAWFRKHRRDLPWRQNTDAYRVWLSEIMLQQTQVATVVPYFERFMAQFPTVRALADADETDVLRLWEGLGYYRRARQLHAAAQVVCRDYDGVFPRMVEELLHLPGIGRYTAGAIASIAYDVPAPIVEANTQRLYARLLAYPGELHTKQAQQLLWQFAAAMVPARGAGEMNQALMELGSLICTPREPKCDVCPLLAHCPTAQRGLQAKIPVAKRPKNFETQRHAAVVVRHRGKVLLRQCGPNERWAGLWDFPRFVVEPATANGNFSQALIEGVQQQAAIQIVPGNHLATFKHGVTRFRITLECYSATLTRSVSKAPVSPTLQRGTAPPINAETNPLKWLKPSELDAIPLSTTGRKLAKLLVSGG
jgi:A/G-specific adenine glycosylase